jgi:hypothetical protein
MSPPSSGSTFNGPHGVISQKIELFISSVFSIYKNAANTCSETLEGDLKSLSVASEKGPLFSFSPK